MQQPFVCACLWAGVGDGGFGLLFILLYFILTHHMYEINPKRLTWKPLLSPGFAECVPLRATSTELRHRQYFLNLTRNCHLVIGFKELLEEGIYVQNSNCVFGIFFYWWMEVILTRQATGARARALPCSCGAMAPPSGQQRPLVGRAVRAQEEGSELVAGAGPGQESERTALLREVNAHPRLYFPFSASNVPPFPLRFCLLLKWGDNQQRISCSLSREVVRKSSGKKHFYAQLCATLSLRVCVSHCTSCLSGTMCVCVCLHVLKLTLSTKWAHFFIRRTKLWHTFNCLYEIHKLTSSRTKNRDWAQSVALLSLFVHCSPEQGCPRSSPGPRETGEHLQEQIFRGSQLCVR